MLSNSIAMTPGNDAVVDWMRQYQTQKRRCEEENGVLRNIVKRAKSDGINTKEMIAVVALSKLDPDQVQADLRDRVRYMALRRMPVIQVELFGGLDVTLTPSSQQKDDLWDAEEAGYRAGRHGASRDDCPYPPATEMYVHWVEFWFKGQAAIARELGDNAKIASTSRARPARQTDLEEVIASQDGIGGTGENIARTEDSTAASDESVVVPPAKRGRGRPRKANGVRRPRARRAGPASEVASTPH